MQDQCLAGLNLRLFRLQSAHTLLASSLRRLLIVAWFWAARSAFGFGGRRDISIKNIGWRGSKGQVVARFRFVRLMLLKEAGGLGCPGYRVVV